MDRIASKPVKAYRTPTYPTKLQVLDNGDLLRKHIPHAWLGHKELAGLASVFLCVNTVGCADEGTTPPKPGRLTKDAAAIVAPIFEHGEGYDYSRGVGRGFALCSPVLLCEADALQIITDELALHGVHLTEQNVELPSVVIDGAEMGGQHDWISGKDEFRVTPIEGPLEMDLYDPARNIGVEFVCQDDFAPLGGDLLGGDLLSRPVESVRRVAASIAEEVKDKGKNVCFGSFYDPVPYWDFDSIELKDGETYEVAWKRTERECEAEAKNLLRQQVKDFADWLKGQGVI